MESLRDPHEPGNIEHPTSNAEYRMRFSSSRRKLLISAAAISGWILALSATAEQLTQTQTEFFENKIRPLLADQCYKCHSSQAPKLKGGLSLENREGWVKGGDTGPAIVPGNPDASLLIKAVRYTDEDLQMPPKGHKLSDDQIADLVNWVKMGAPDPRTGLAIAKKDPKDHWAFKPVKRSAGAGRAGYELGQDAGGRIRPRQAGRERRKTESAGRQTHANSPSNI